MGKYSKLILSLTLLFGAAAQALDVPPLTRPVEDRMGILSEEQKIEIESSLRRLHKENKAQISILIIPSLEGEILESYSMKVAEQWNLGTKTEDNGLLVLFAINDRVMRIEVGQGLEGDITDIESRRLLDSMKPFLRQQEYSAGLLQLVSRIESTIDYNTPAMVERREREAAAQAAARKESQVVFFGIMKMLAIIAISLGAAMLLFLSVKNYLRSKDELPLQNLKQMQVIEEQGLEKDKEEYQKESEATAGLTKNAQNYQFESLQQQVSTLIHAHGTLVAEIGMMKRYLGDKS